MYDHLPLFVIFKLPTFTYLHVISDYYTHHHAHWSHTWWRQKKYYTADSKDKIRCQLPHRLPGNPAQAVWLETSAKIRLKEITPQVMPTYEQICLNILTCITCFIPIHFEPSWYTGAPLYLVNVWAKDWLPWQRFFMFPPATSCKCHGGILIGYGHFLPYPYLLITHD